MRTPFRFLALAVLAFGPLMIVSACSKDDGASNRTTTPSDKPMTTTERAGHDVKEGTKEVGRDVKEGAQGAASAAGSAVERAGEKMQGKLALEKDALQKRVEQQPVRVERGT